MFNLILIKRFNTSPFAIGDISNPHMQVSHENGHNGNFQQHGEPYSPTLPLQLTMEDTASDMGDKMVGDTLPAATELRLGIRCTSTMFPEKRRRNGELVRAQYAESFFMFAGNVDQVKKKKRQKRYEEWDAKGGLSMRRYPSSDSFLAKAITDVSMAQALEVEPGVMSSNKGPRNRLSRTSPLDSTGIWSLKRSRSNSSASPVMSQIGENEHEGMELHFSLMVSIADDNTERVVVDPNQPPRSP